MTPRRSAKRGKPSVRHIPAFYETLISKEAAASCNLAVPLATELMAARAALESIAKNTCCGPCQEAALVAKRALGGG